MRKILCASLIVFAAISCKDDDEAPKVKGTWIVTEETYTGCDNVDQNGTITYDDDGCYDGNCKSITFTGNEFISTSSGDSGSGDITFPYKQKGSKITVTTPFGDIIYGYKVEGNILTLTFDDQQDGCLFTGKYRKQ